MKKKVKKKTEKEELKKARLEFMNDNEKWEVSIRARATGSSSSQNSTTARPDAPDGEKTTDEQ